MVAWQRKEVAARLPLPSRVREAFEFVVVRCWKILPAFAATLKCDNEVIVLQPIA